MNCKPITKTALVIGFAIIIMGWHASGVFSAEAAKPAKEEKELKFSEKMAAILFEEEAEAFFYQREGRADPFVPFIQERVVATKMPVEELTGMRKFEPGQLTVVAIVMTHDDKFAMVQTANNQGYIIREGILLGRTGVVEAISPNKVAVKRYTFNLAGDKIYKTVEMLLKKEGEK